MLCFGKAKTDVNIEFIPKEKTKEWIRKFSSKYYEIKDHYYNISCDEGVILYAFIYAYMKCEFEDREIDDIFNPVKRFADSKVFRKTKPEEIFNVIEKALAWSRRYN